MNAQCEWEASIEEISHHKYPGWEAYKRQEKATEVGCGREVGMSILGHCSSSWIRFGLECKWGQTLCGSVASEGIFIILHLLLRSSDKRDKNWKMTRMAQSDKVQQHSLLLSVGATTQLQFVMEARMNRWTCQEVTFFAPHVKPQLTIPLPLIINAHLLAFST